MQQFLTENSIYVVLAIILIIWFGIAIFLISIDNKLKKIERLGTKFNKSDE